MEAYARNFSIARQYSPWDIAQWNQQFGNAQNQNKIVNPKTGTEIELSQLLNSVKNDVVSGERGGQWLLSCYAPFKEKPPYPGFVDMSFEEVRFGFLEAQKSNTLQQYGQQLQQLLSDARNRYKSLENPTKEIVELIKNIYNNNLNSGNNSFFGQNSQESGLKGLFGLSNASVFGQQNNIGSGNSIFRQQGAAQNNFVPQSGSVFGQSNAPTNTGSIFGQQQSVATPFQQANPAQNSGNLFAQQSNANGIFGQKTGSIFGQQQSGGSIFGQQNAPSGGSIFGQANTASGSIFGQNNTNSIVNTTQANSSPFSQTNAGSIFGKQSAFGQQNQNAGLFGQQNSGINSGGSVFGTQQTTASGSGIFGQQNNPTGSNVVQSNNPNSGIFFSQPNANQGSVSIFGLNAPQSGSNNIFQSKAQAESTQQTNNVFNTQAGNLFKPNPQSSAFGNTQATTLTPQQSSIFTKASEQGNSAAQNSIFQTSGNKPPTSSIFGVNPTNTPSSGNPSKKYIEWGAYSKKEQLSEEEIKWFNSEEFDIDNIPENPPTYEMCF